MASTKVLKTPQQITSITHFVPKRIHQLTQIKKVTHNNMLLKTSIIFDMTNMMATKYYFNEDSEFNLSAKILQETYGCHYKHYIEYLKQSGIISLKSKHFKGKKCTTYKLNLNIFKEGMIRFKNSDSFVIKKWHKRRMLHNSKNASKTLNIPWQVKQKMIQDLELVDINYLAAHTELCRLYNIGEINSAKFYKNLSSITSIANKEIFYTEDDYGRFHTNFTILKKCFREQNLTIAGEQIAEVDITNSQPMFLTLLLKEHNFDQQCPIGYQYFYNLVKNGKIYEEIMNYSNVDRSRAKQLFYSVLFGQNTGKKINVEANKMFMNLFPDIWVWINQFKLSHNNHRILAHMLQLRESNIMYNVICHRMITEMPLMPYFTVHDSAFFPVKYKKRVEKIFHEVVSQLM
jgi:hypothetical protein